MGFLVSAGVWVDSLHEVPPRPPRAVRYSDTVSWVKPSDDNPALFPLRVQDPPPPARPLPRRLEPGPTFNPFLLPAYLAYPILTCDQPTPRPRPAIPPRSDRGAVGWDLPYIVSYPDVGQIAAFLVWDVPPQAGVRRLAPKRPADIAPAVRFPPFLEDLVVGWAGQDTRPTPQLPRRPGPSGDLTLGFVLADSALTAAYDFQPAAPGRPAARQVGPGQAPAVVPLPDTDAAALHTWDVPGQLPPRPARGVRPDVPAEPTEAYRAVFTLDAWPALAFQPPGPRAIPARPRPLADLPPGTVNVEAWQGWNVAPQVPPRPPGKGVERSETWAPSSAAAFAVPGNLVVVSGPFFVAAAQFYVAGATAGTVEVSPCFL